MFRLKKQAAILIILFVTGGRAYVEFIDIEVAKGIIKLITAGPIHFIPPIVGTVTDAVTGEPIEGVVVEARYGKFRLIDAFFVRPGVSAGEHKVVTDKNGGYYIPKKTIFDILGCQAGVGLKFDYPLYRNIIPGQGGSVGWTTKSIKLLKKIESEMKKRGITTKEEFYKKVGGSPEWDIRYLLGEFKNGAIHYNHHLIRPEELFREKPWCWSYREYEESVIKVAKEIFLADIDESARDPKKCRESLENFEKIIATYPDDESLWNLWQKDIQSGYGHYIKKSLSKKDFLRDYSRSYLIKEFHKIKEEVEKILDIIEKESGDWRKIWREKYGGEKQ